MNTLMQRRSFITLLGGAAAAWPLVARAQQSGRLPTIGFLVTASAQGYADQVAAVRQGIADVGYVEGRNLAIESRFANDQYDRLPELAADLVQRRVAVIFATGSVISPLAAKDATTTIPIVFAIGSDPVKYGLVASLGRPGGNVTGMSFYNSELGPKRLELLREILPKAASFGMLVNPNNPNADSDANDVTVAARSIGMRIFVAKAGNEGELDAAFTTITQQQADGLIIINNDALFQSRGGIQKIVALMIQHRLPAIFGGSRAFVAGGGLMSYGTNTTEMYRLAGGYVGRILKGEKPADLPVQQPVKFGLQVNLKAAKTLGLTIPGDIPGARRRGDRIGMRQHKKVWRPTAAVGQNPPLRQPLAWQLSPAADML
jgi:putative ABC transport system substrate-binding protein